MLKQHKPVTAETASADLRPNLTDINAHFYALFAPEFVTDFPDAWIEIAYGLPNANLNEAQNYSAFSLKEAAEFAEAKTKSGYNIYIGPALRHGKQPRSGRANKEHFLASAFFWAEYDQAGDHERISAICTAEQLKPAIMITTGTTPHRRVHLYFKAATPVTDIGELEAGNTSLRDKFGSDDVQNCDRVMRLGGTINYPSPAKLQRGYQTELTTVQINQHAPSYSVEALCALAPATVSNGTVDCPFAAYAETGPKTGKSDDELIALIKQSRATPGKGWRKPMLSFIASTVNKGWSDLQIRLAAASFSDGGVDDPEIQKEIDYTRRNTRRNFDKPDHGDDVAPAAPAATPLKKSYLSIRNASTFAGEYRAADYLVDGLLQTGWLYALTAQTGTGKTALALYLSQCVADGKPFAGREVDAGAVLYCAGENPDDLRQRFHAMCDDLERSPDSFNIHFLTPETNKGLLIGFDEIKEYVASVGHDFRCVVVDTAAAFFDGEDENSNDELGDYARRLRRLRLLPGRPAIIVPCHPIKNPKAREECVPRGGGSFVNEIDGNMILWPISDGLVELHWTRKFRAPPWDPVLIQLRQVETTTIKDAKDRPVKSILAAVLNEQEAANRSGAARADHTMILTAMLEHPGATTPTGIAMACLWVPATDKQRSRVRRRLTELKAAKLVEQSAVGLGWHLTAKGKAETKRLIKGDDTK
jgi:hypothetical protein